MGAQSCGASAEACARSRETGILARRRRTDLNNNLRDVDLFVIDGARGARAVIGVQAASRPADKPKTGDASYLIFFPFFCSTISI